MSKEEYKQNRERVYEIYEVDIHDRRYNCHHIIGRHEYQTNKRFWDDGSANGEFDVDGKGNLIPLRKEDHERIHEQLGDFIKPRKKRN
jgi:hypothetical protein